MQTRVRSGFTKREPYPLNQPTKAVIMSICQRIVYQLAGGCAEMDGADWSRIFAQSIGGVDRPSPLGLADVSWNGCCWSLKTVKSKRPFGASKIRLISGRNSPQYSSGISDPFHDIRDTGHSVLSIYNNRLSEARTEHNDVRLGALLRNLEDLEFTFFERPITPLVVNDYEWKINKRENFEAFYEGRHVFTWQPHGSQFTLIEPVPASATRFRIVKRPGVANLEVVLRDVGFTEEWVQIIDQ